MIGDERDGAPCREHDEEQDAQADEDEKELGLEGHSIICAPQIKLTPYQMKVMVIQADGLPRMNAFQLTGDNEHACDPYVSITFANNAVIRTAFKTGTSCPLWEEELLVPVYMPMPTDTIRVQVFDHDYGHTAGTDDGVLGDDLIGQVTVSFEAVTEGTFTDLRWWNLYGPVKGTPEEAARRMRRNQMVGSKWRGRVLMGLRASVWEEAQGAPQASDPGTILRTAIPKPPPTRLYRAVLDVGTALQLPTGAHLVFCKVSLGYQDRGGDTSNKTPVHAMEGHGLLGADPGAGADAGKVCRQAGRRAVFNEQVVTQLTEFPVDLRQVPDVFVEIWEHKTMVSSKKLVCFVRIPAAQLGESCPCPDPCKCDPCECGPCPYPKWKWVEMLPGPGADAGCAPALILFRLTLLKEERPKSNEDTAELCKMQHQRPQSIPDILDSTGTEYFYRHIIYQAQHLPSLREDSLTTSPYVLTAGAAPLRFTPTQSQTTFPVWEDRHEQFLWLPSDLEKAPPVCLLVFDSSTWPHSLLGYATIPATSAAADADEYQRDYADGGSPPAPRWLDLHLFGKTRSDISATSTMDATARILVSTWLFRPPKNYIPDAKLPPKLKKGPRGHNRWREELPQASLPARRPCRLEVAILGIRGPLKNAGYFSITAPSVRISLGQFNSPLQISETAPSCTPEATAPNFGQLLSIKLNCPEDRLLAPTLRCDVLDNRVGGTISALIGSAFVPLSTVACDLPSWRLDPSETAPHCCKAHREGGNTQLGGVPTFFRDRAGGSDYASSTGERTDDSDSETDENAATRSVVEADTDHTEGFRFPYFMTTSPRPQPAPSHSEERAPDPEVPANPREGKEEEHEEAWMEGRENVRQELEHTMLTRTFCEFEIWRMHKPLGMIKAVIRITEEDRGELQTTGAEEASVSSRGRQEQIFDFFQHSVPEPTIYLLRAYVIRARDLAVPEVAVLNPYLHVWLGREVVTFKGKASRQALIPDFFKKSSGRRRRRIEFRECVELTVSLPGVSMLHFEVWHCEPLRSDQLVGTSVLDLETRLFSAEWRSMAIDRPDQPPLPKLESRRLKLAAAATGLHGASRFSGGTRGKLDVWVELWSKELGEPPPRLDIAEPSREPFVVRVVVWKAKAIPPQDAMTQMSDLFFRAILTKVDSLDGGTPFRQEEETDTHWRIKRGIGSFNYRLVFDDLDLPLGQGGQVRLQLQAWDQDLLWKDYISAAVLDITQEVKQAYRAYRAGMKGESAIIRFPRNEQDSNGKRKRIPPRSPAVFGSSNITGALEAPVKQGWCAACISTCWRWWCCPSLSLDMGAPEVDDDKQWVQLYGKKVSESGSAKMGIVQISISVLHKEVSERFPAGKARQKPNNFPMLSDPARVEWNPLRPDLMLLDILGPDLFRKFAAISTTVSILYFLLNVVPAIVGAILTAIEINEAASGE
ncbi:hypothetical protein CYMTET_42855 [Cymbomonas tetramitiformis]|uniref:C2 domain-containing protein n=1 Tax=Cymbomonas tetramitiformis TaxID=36881 RepID=A0AAE0C4M2_9CHLO|nr:hypothetical protein CYMTET_42855 [Cymbomonas tetramitiformis]